MNRLRRCAWAEGTSPAYRRYHDEEWGVPVRDDRKQFEFLVLESAQAGLSWATILQRREGYREAFCEFDPRQVSRFGKAEIEALLMNPAIIRNRAKVEAAVGNARRFLGIRREFGSFSNYIWDFVDGEPQVNRWQLANQVPTTSPVSDALAKDMKVRGFRFLGSTILYAHLQATGLVNDHLLDCFRRRELLSGRPGRG